MVQKLLDGFWWNLAVIQFSRSIKLNKFGDPFLDHYLVRNIVKKKKSICPTFYWTLTKYLLCYWHSHDPQLHSHCVSFKIANVRMLMHLTKVLNMVNISYFSIIVYKNMWCFVCYRWHLNCIWWWDLHDIMSVVYLFLSSCNWEHVHKITEITWLK